MGCVQSRAAQNPAADVLPTSVKVANSTKTGVAPGQPGQPSHTGDPIYLDRADTWGQPTETPLNHSAASFQIKSEGQSSCVRLLAYLCAVASLGSPFHGTGSRNCQCNVVNLVQPEKFNRVTECGSIRHWGSVHQESIMSPRTLVL